MTEAALSLGAARASVPLPSRVSRPSYTIAAVRDLAAFETLAGEWAALEAASPAPTLFQSVAWCRQVLALEVGRASSGFEPLVLVARDGCDLAGLLPLRRLSRSAVIVTGLGEPFQQYSDLILAPGADGATVLDEMLASPHLAGTDAIELLKVRADSALYAALGSRAAGLQPVEAAPFVDLTPFPDFAAYHKTINAKSRKNMRNQRNRLAREASLTAVSYTEPADIEALIRTSFEGRLAWLEREGLSSRAFRDPDFARLVANFADVRTTGIEILAIAVQHGDRTIAVQWGFVHKRRYYAYVASWDPAYEEASPGKLIMEEVLRVAHARGIKVADFLMPAARYKFTWAEAATPVYDIVLPLSLRGQVTARLWTGWLRPLAKRAVLAMPPRLRNCLKRASGHDRATSSRP